MSAAFVALRGRRNFAVLGLLLVGLLAGVAGPAVAEAAPAHFAYEECDSALPGGNAPGAQFVVNPGVPFAGADTCVEPGGSLSITEVGPTAAAYAYWDLPIPPTPGGYVEAVTISGAACGLGAGNDHTFVFEPPWPGNTCTESPHYFHVASEPESFAPSAFSVLMNCDGNVSGGCAAGPTIYARYFLATEADPTPPVLSAPEGSLLAGGVLRGHQTLAARASDVGGGLSRVYALVNGLAAGEPELGSCALAAVKNTSYTGVVATTVSPCPASLSPSWTLDTAAAPFHDGSNSVSVCAADFATSGEPNTTCSPPVGIDVNNSCAESPVVGGAVLSAQFAGSNDEAVTVPYDHPAEVTGELADAAGDPIAGATICVEARLQGAQGSPRPVATATTDAEGEFTHKVAPGPNRHLLIGYRHDSFQVARIVDYHARARPTLRLRPGRVKDGGRVRISGRLPGPRAAGRVVVLQASALHGRRWLTFHRATANHRGEFHSSYRFGAATQTITYRIRAVAPRQRGYPYDAGHSKPARVKVRGR